MKVDFETALYNLKFADDVWVDFRNANIQFPGSGPHWMITTSNVDNGRGDLIINEFDENSKNNITFENGSLFIQDSRGDKVGIMLLNTVDRLIKP